MYFLIVLKIRSLRSRCWQGHTPFILASLNFQWLLAFLVLWPCHSNLQATIFKSAPALSSPGFFYMCQIFLYLPCIHGIALQTHSRIQENLPKSKSLTSSYRQRHFSPHIKYISTFQGLGFDYMLGAIVLPIRVIVIGEPRRCMLGGNEC